MKSVAIGCALIGAAMLGLAGCGGDQSETLVLPLYPTAPPGTTRVPTSVPVIVPTATRTRRIPTITRTPTATRTVTQAPTRTFTPSPAPTSTPSLPLATRTFTPTLPATLTATASHTGTPTHTPTATVTHTVTVAAATDTPTQSPTTAPTDTATPTQTATAVSSTSTPTLSPTAAVEDTSTPTLTPTGALADTPTPTSTPTPTTTEEIAPTATPTSGSSAVCDNGFIESGETCESCPQDCAIHACTATTTLRQFRVDFSAPTGRTATAVTVLIGYQSDVVSLPGSADASSVRQRVKMTPSNAIVQVNDLDYALRIVVGRGVGVPSGKLSTIDFDSCQGAAAPTAADFGCTVEGCGGGSGPIKGCTCTITTP